MVETHAKERNKLSKGAMHRAFKLLAWVNGLAAIALALLLALPSFIDWGGYKAKIIKVAEEQLGVAVKIEGAVYAQFLPVPVLKLNRVFVSNSQNGEMEHLAVKRVDVELDFISLLGGEVEPRAFLLQEASFQFGLSEKKSWFTPAGFKALFLGQNSHPITRFGVKGSKIQFVGMDSKTGFSIENVNFVAEKSGALNNWLLEGYFDAQKSRHGFELVTRARPGKKTTFIDARIKMKSGGDIVQNFNGSIAEGSMGALLEGRYTAAGTYGKSEAAYTLSAGGRVFASGTKIGFTGTTLSLTPKGGTVGVDVRPALLRADVNLFRSQDFEKWKLRSEVALENISKDQLKMVLRDSVTPMKSLYRLNKLAHFVDGDLSIRGVNFKSGQTSFPRLWANFIFANNLAHISDAGLTLPGGGRMQIEGLQAKVRDLPRGGEIYHKGLLYLETETIGDLTAFMPSLLHSKDFLKLSSSSNPVSMSGLVYLDQDELKIETQSLLMNGSQGSAKLLLKNGTIPETQISINFKKVNTDRLMNTGNRNLAEIFASLLKQVGGDLKDRNEKRVAKFDFSSGTLLFRGTTLKDFQVKGLISKDKFTLTKLRSGGSRADDVRISLSGGLKDITTKPQGVFDFTMSSAEAIDALSLLGPKFLVSQRGRAFISKSEHISPLIFRAKFTSGQESDLGEVWRVQMDGRLASTSFVSEGAIKPDWETSAGFISDIDMQFEMSNPSSRVLAGQLFSLRPDILNALPETEGYLRASLSGSGKNGFDIAFGGEVSDVQVTLGGTAKFVDGIPAIAAQVKLIAPDSRSLLSFAGLKTRQNLGRTEYIANLAGRGDQFVLSGGRGLIWGRDTEIEARMDLAPKKPVLSASIRAGELRQKALLNAAQIALEKIGKAHRAFDFFEAKIALVSPLLSVKEGVEIADAQAHVTIGQNKITLSHLKGQLYGGNMVMQAHIERGNSGYELSAQYELKDAHFERALLQENLEQIAKGQFTLAGEVTSRAEKWQKLGHNLNGRGYVKAGKGEIGGINPAAFGRSVRFVSNGTELDGMIGGILTQGSLPYNQFQTAYMIKDAILQTSKTQLISREVTSENITRIDLVEGKINSDWNLQLTRLPQTPRIKLNFHGTRYNLKRQLLSRELRTHLMAMMRRGESLSQRFALQNQGVLQKADPIQTGTIKKEMMKKPVKLEGLKIIPKINPLRGSN